MPHILDELHDFVVEVEDSAEVIWTSNPNYENCEIEKVENESGESYSVLLLAGRQEYGCAKCAISLLVENSPGPSELEGRNCPKCSSPMILEKSDDSNEDFGFKLLQS